ncbi:MAG: phasin family protein [Calditrichia bacterium]
MTDDKQKDLQDKARKIQEEVTERSREIWLAGLGMFSTIEKEGAKLFQDFVERGEGLRQKGKELEDESESFIKGLRDDVAVRAGDVAQIVEENLSNAINSFGFTRGNEVDELKVKVEKLTAKVEKLSKKLKDLEK